MGAKTEYPPLAGPYATWLGARYDPIFTDFTAKGTKDNLLVVGGGLDFSQAGDGNLVSFTVDGQFETGTGLGVWRSIRRERFQTWTPAASIRERAPRD